MPARLASLILALLVAAILAPNASASDAQNRTRAFPLAAATHAGATAAESPRTRPGSFAAAARTAAGCCVAAKAGAGAARREFEVVPRVAGQLQDSRLGPLAGRLGPDDLQRLVQEPGAKRFFDTRTGNINVVQEVDGVLLRITTPRDAFKIISVGPIRQRQLENGIRSGRFGPMR